MARISLSVLLLLPMLGCGLPDPEGEAWDPPVGAARAGAPVPREPCAGRDALRQAFFGDLHVHTGISADARSRDMTLMPDDAYRYSRGEEVLLPAGAGQPAVPTRIDRPLDFAAVTDHAEYFAEVRVCTEPAMAGYDSSSCKMYRGEETPLWAFWIPPLVQKFVALSALSGRNESLCGDGASPCREVAARVWEETRAAAERWYDRSPACRFTTFQAWEYSRSPRRSKVHHNVILRNELAPELPLSWIDTPDATALWKGLQELCNGTGTGCEALTIAHNPNLSNGRAFRAPDESLPLEEQRELARLRTRFEPVVEMTQAKGDSECRNGLADVLGEDDPLCDHEKMRSFRGDEPEDCGRGIGEGAIAGDGCASSRDFARSALVVGMRETERLGVAPFRVGFIGSTDTHNATPGAVSERRFIGTRGSATISAEQRLDGLGSSSQDELIRNPGGLAGVWAEENSRDSLFDGMKRAETFATTGPRIRPRFFGGWSFPEDWCERDDAIALGYASGVPMGGDLPPRGDGASPVFAVSALRDSGTDTDPGGRLQRIQIIKGWADDEGRIHQRVVDVAGGPNGADVDLASCTPRGAGADSLCGVWRDPEFDPSQRAAYYARVVENPSCRWTTWQCLDFPEDERPAGCDEPDMPKTIQERAITSPIWYAP